MHIIYYDLNVSYSPFLPYSILVARFLYLFRDMLGYPKARLNRPLLVLSRGIYHLILTLEKTHGALPGYNSLMSLEFILSYISETPSTATRANHQLTNSPATTFTIPVPPDACVYHRGEIINLVSLLSPPCL